MKKLILHSIGNWGSYNHYVFDKKQKVAETLSKILKKSLDVDWELFDHYFKGKKEIYNKINIEKYKDFHQEIGSGHRIDIFYGDKKMFFAVFCSLEFRAKFNDELFKFFKMPRYVKSKKSNRIRKIKK